MLTSSNRLGTLIVAPWLILLTSACSAQGDGSAPNGAALPAPVQGDALQVSKTGIQLPERKAEESDVLHNVFKLSDRIISGSEPEGQVGLEAVRKMGVRTILSVDGKAPDAEAAARLGMRYVHIPIGYDGVTEAQRLRIAKTFRELEGPFFVHCFHGRHRGPAAAAIGRVVLDGVGREQALAEMRQWCGVGEGYTGLYETIGKAPIPDAHATKALDDPLAPISKIGGLQETMVQLARIESNLKLLGKVAWKQDPKHPDLVAVEEAKRAAYIFRELNKDQDTASRPEDYRNWMDRSVDQADALVAALEKLRAGDAEAAERAKTLYTQLTSSCTACHKVYRDH